MNKAETKKVRAAISALGATRLDVDVIKDALESKYDEASEKWQDSEAGAKVRDLISHLADAASNIESAERDLAIAIQKK